ncbi:hypothetical protein ACFXTH_001147 [Malus domestica]
MWFCLSLRNYRISPLLRHGAPIGSSRTRHHRRRLKHGRQINPSGRRPNNLHQRARRQFRHRLPSLKKQLPAEQN